MRDQFHDKFEQDATYHSYCLRSDGCFKRHDRPREEQYLTKNENRRADLNTYSPEESKERRLLNKVAFLQGLGCVLRAEETLEEYVNRNVDKLRGEG